MAIGDIYYRITNIGGNYTEVGYIADPTTTLLPSIFSNESLKEYSYNIEFYANTSTEVENIAGVIDTYANTALLDVNVVSDPIYTTATKVSNNTINVTSSTAFEPFPGELYKFLTIFPETGETTENEMTILSARNYLLSNNEFVLEWTPPDPDTNSVEYVFNLKKDAGTPASNYTYTQDLVWSSQEGLILFNTFSNPPADPSEFVDPSDFPTEL